MLVSLNKNPWLWKWIYDRVGKDYTELHEYLVSAFAKTRPEEIKKGYVRKLEDFGYRVKFTSNNDTIITMTEEEYMFLKLKYE